MKLMAMPRKMPSMAGFDLEVTGYLLPERARAAGVVTAHQRPEAIDICMARYDDILELEPSLAGRRAARRHRDEPLQHRCLRRAARRLHRGAAQARRATPRTCCW